MEWFEALAVLLGVILVLMAIGMPVALAFLAANILGAWVFMGGERGVSQLLNNGFGSLTKYALMPIPLFLLMGEIFFYTGLGGRMFNAIDKLLGKLPGRLSYVTVLGGTAFSTLSGSSMGSTALLGSLMVPEMSRRGYKSYMSIGPILGTGGLAIIIPPSALAVYWQHWHKLMSLHFCLQALYLVLYSPDFILQRFGCKPKLIQMPHLPMRCSL